MAAVVVAGAFSLAVVLANVVASPVPKVMLPLCACGLLVVLGHPAVMRDC